VRLDSITLASNASVNAVNEKKPNSRGSLAVREPARLGLNPKALFWLLLSSSQHNVLIGWHESCVEKLCPPSKHAHGDDEIVMSS
jgi:hypothetical protein